MRLTAHLSPYVVLVIIISPLSLFSTEMSYKCDFAVCYYF